VDTVHYGRRMTTGSARRGLVSLVAVGLFGLAACDSGGGGADTPTPTPTPTASAAAGLGGPKAATSAAPVVTKDPVVLADGRHAVFLTQLDVDKRTLAFDKIDFLTGEAAKKEYLKQNPAETDGPPDDYLIVNNNPLVRTLPIAPGATILIVDLTGDSGVTTKKTTLAALPAYFAKNKGEKYLWYDPFWLTVKKGRITRIEEQFVP